MKQTLKSFVWVIIVVVLFYIVTQFTGQLSISLDFADTALTVTGPKEFSYTVEYDKIESLELVELTDTGTVLSGGESRRLAWGERENEAWGTYTLCISKKIDIAILVTTVDGEKLVLNYEKEKTTESMLDLFTQFMEHQDAA